MGENQPEIYFSGGVHFYSQYVSIVQDFRVLKLGLVAIGLPIVLVFLSLFNFILMILTAESQFFIYSLSSLR